MSSMKKAPPQQRPMPSNAAAAAALASSSSSSTGNNRNVGNNNASSARVSEPEIIDLLDDSSDDNDDDDKTTTRRNTATGKSNSNNRKLATARKKNDKPQAAASAAAAAASSNSCSSRPLIDMTNDNHSNSPKVVITNRKRPPPSAASASASGLAAASSSRKRGLSRNYFGGGGDDDVVILDTVKSSSGPNSKESSAPFVRLLELYGDADPPHIRKLLTDNKDNVEVVANLMADNGYPRAKPRFIRRAKATPSIKSEPLYNYDKANNKFNEDCVYRTEAAVRLAYDFPFLKLSPVREYFRQNHSSYTLARRYINDVLAGKKRAIGGPNDHSKPAAAVAAAPAGAGATAGPNNAGKAEIDSYQNLKMMKRLQKSLQEMEQRDQKEVKIPKYIRKRVGNVNLKNTYDVNDIKTCPNITHEVLKDETLHFEDGLKKWQGRVYQTMRRDALNKIAQEENNSTDCVICADEVAGDNMISCGNGHKYCFDCVENYANDKIFSSTSIGVDPKTKKPALGLICCSSVATDCTSVFPEPVLAKVLPEKTYFHYERLAFMNYCASKGKDGEVMYCSKCWSYFELIPPKEKVFSCLDCGFECCKSCGHENHSPLTCEEFEEKRRQERLSKLKDAARVRMEDAASAALMRYCPTCKKPGIRESGCNHITCKPCKPASATTHWCYVCLQKIPCHPHTYSHFCSQPHCEHKKCKKCPLHSNATVEKKQEEQKARDAAAAERARIQAEHGNNGPQIDIDVDQVVRDPTKTTRKTKSSRAPRGGRR
mmetsp:Transcript_57862/g.141368  ORF Transcript_57862/g.141368 Transcript_57862/m.141368 type:complete len:770 (+) Transcript_57862:221-2530(+)